MPHFKVNSRPFWDGVVMHPRGTILDIDREDYGQLLCLDFVPMDEQAKRDIEDAKRRCLDKIADDVEEVTGKRPKLKFNPLYLEERGELNPNDRDELRKLTPRGARVVTKIAKEESKVVRPGSAGAVPPRGSVEPEVTPDDLGPLVPKQKSGKRARKAG
jgi:ribosomal protein S19E (S16A)